MEKICPLCGSKNSDIEMDDGFEIANESVEIWSAYFSAP
jgi:Zn finger protein HypA/HybF involved in hydrogenase expression